MGRSARCANLRHSFFSLSGLVVEHFDMSALLREEHGDGFADARPGTGDNGGFVSQ
jgi:hypothetical protein